jgi:hypothetical protein
MLQMPRIRDHRQAPSTPRRHRDHFRRKHRAARTRQRDRDLVTLCTRGARHSLDASGWYVVRANAATRVRERRFGARGP